ncbi:hypothetical protein PRK78_000303 [Emydomyces testavorans]|uniref:J domain-containing protein n=1 Tax=Emydomyces testavorans TaxID=2070801 RepID=A0AAF0DC87_9EURO|nr:hypothetical protein PRK78_000303 [Emydomyces testavorans]
MVKVDVRRDYYAELGLDIRAEPQEIRKQYRKLALEYHPDRNPGKEAEFIPIFQGIQTAYEILNDSHLRSKYDSDRLRAGYGKHYTSSRTTANPRTPNPGSPFTTTPPRRTTTAPPSKPSHSSRGSYPPPPSTPGPQKWNSYTNPGASKWGKGYEDVRTRAEAYRGFQNMKHNAHPTGGWTNFDPRTGRSSHESVRSEKPTTPKQQQSQRSYSAYESYFTTQKHAGSTPQRSQSTKKRNGFAPGTPGGDEPMAKSTSAYASILRGERGQASSPYFEPAPSPTAKKQPTEKENRPGSMPNLERTSSKYATTGGEKTYVSSAGLGFANNARNTPSKDSGSRPQTNPPSQTASPNSERHHSASPKLRPNRNRASYSSPASSDSDEILPSFRPKAVPRSRTRKNGPRFDSFSQYGKDHITGEASSAWAMRPDSWLFDETTNGHQNLPSPSSSVEFDERNANFNIHEGVESENTNHSKPTDRMPFFSNSSKTSTPLANTAGSAHRSENATPTDNEERRSSTANMYGTHKPSVHHWSTNWDSSSLTGTDSLKFPPVLANHQYVIPPIARMGRPAESSDQKHRPAEEEENKISYIQFRAKAMFSFTFMLPSTNADLNTISSFTATKTAADKNESYKTTPKSKSHDYINTTFSAKDWSGTFGNGADFFAPVSSGSTPPTSRTSTRGRTLDKHDISSHFQSSDSSQKADNATADRASSQPAPPFPENEFSADGWAELLKDNAWTVPNTDGFQRHSADSRRQKSPRKQSKPASKRPAIPRPATVTTEAEETEAAYAPAAAAAAETAEAMDIDETLPGAQDTQAANAKESANPLSANGPPVSNMTIDPLDLRNIGLVNPFTATNKKGINDLKDLNSTLPFNSQSSSDRTRIKPRGLSLPNPPKPPTLPNLAVNPGLPGMKPEQDLARVNWDRYMADMAAYMKEWNTFNRTMLTHFNARQNFVDTMLSPNWMNARGDSSRLNLGENQIPAALAADDDDEDESGDEKCRSKSGKFGFNTYLRGMEEDFVVRQHWEVAWERHRQCILNLGCLRTWIREGKNTQPFSSSGPLL